jgi:Concanavalin A-like lectin/glucanases superfamily/Carboxypeptidase regulatory-like domain
MEKTMMKTTTKHANFLLFTFTFLLFSLNGFAQTCSPAPIGLVSWWQAENNALDSRSLNNGTLQNGATFASGHVGQAFSLDGVDDFIRVNASASLNVGTANGYTIEAWVNPQSNNGEPIVEFDSPTTVGVHLWTSVGGANNLFAGLNSSIQSPDNAVPLNTFSHVAVTYDKLTGLAQLFVNGVIVQSANVGIGVPATAFDMNIGGRTLFGLDKFHGKIDELSIYNRTLSLSEIQAIFNAGTAGKCFIPTPTPAPAGLVSWWSGDGNTLDSRSRNNGTLTNGATFTGGNVGQAFDLDGVDDSIFVPDSPSIRPTSLTIEGWFRFDSVSGGVKFLVSKNASSSFSYLVRYSPTDPLQLSLRTGNTGPGSGQNTPLDVSFLPTPAQWNHLAFTFDDAANTQSIYINGVLTASNAAPNPISYTIDPLRLGSNPLGTALFFDGGIDELSIYNRSLSLSEIQTIFNAGTAGKSKPTATVSPSGQVGWWSGDGNANDIAGTNNGTLQDNASFAIGKVGQAFNFDGTDDRIEIPNNAALSPATISLEAWVKPTAINIGSRVISQDISSGSCVSPFVVYSLETRGEFGGRATFFYTTTDNVLHVLQGTTAIPLNVFSHISATFDGTTAKIYVNGVLENNQTVSGSIRSSTTPTIIGNADTACRGIGGNSAGFNGIIDEPSIYNRAITQDEITSIFNAGIAGKLKQNATINSSSLVSLWQGEGNANDTRNANNGTLTNGTAFASGRFGQAFQFGNTQHVSVPDSASLDLTNALTLETWVSPQQIGSAGNNTLLLFKGNSSVLNSQSYGIIYDSGGNTVFRIGNGSTIQQIFGGVLPLNTFTHIVATYDGTTMRIYVNGLQTSSAASSIGTILNTTDPFIIGSNSGTFVGKMDEVAIYSRAISPTEVRANYEAGNALSTVVGDARVTFPTVSSVGITQQIPLDLSTLPSLPLGSTTTGLTYDIATTATFTGSPQVCFNLPSVTNSTIFSNLRILHLESNVWVNRTDLASINFATKAVCTTGLTSLSPFAVVNGFGPTAAESSISGRVTTASGRGIRNAVVQINGGNLGETRYARTNPFGFYRISSLDAGQTYILNIASKRYSFANPTRVITLNEDLTGEDFVSEGK